MNPWLKISYIFTVIFGEIASIKLHLLSWWWDLQRKYVNTEENAEKFFMAIFSISFFPIFWAYLWVNLNNIGMLKNPSLFFIFRWSFQIWFLNGKFISEQDIFITKIGVISFYFSNENVSSLERLSFQTHLHRNQFENTFDLWLYEMLLQLKSLVSCGWVSVPSKKLIMCTNG